MPEPYNEFWAWYVSVYGQDSVNALAKAPNVNQIITPYYQYWQKYIAPKGITPETKKPQQELLPSQIRLSDGSLVDVNYTILGTVESNVLISPTTSFEKAKYKSVTISLYAPVLPASKMNKENMADIYNKIYGVNQETREVGVINEEGVFTPQNRPWAWEDLSDAGILQYDPVNKTVNADDLLKKMAYPSLLDSVTKRIGRTLSPDMDEFLKSQATLMEQGQGIDEDYIVSEVNKLYQFPEYADVLRTQGKLGMKEPDIAKYRAQKVTAGAMTGALQGKPVSEPFQSEEKTLQDKIDTMQKDYDYWKPRYEAGIYNEKVITDPKSAVGAIIREYEATKQRLEDIKSGKVEAGITGLMPETSSQITARAKELGISPQEAIQLGQKYHYQPESPEFKPLSSEEKGRVSELGSIVAGKSASEGGGGGGWSGAWYLPGQNPLERMSPEEHLKAVAEERERMKTPQQKRWEALVEQARRGEAGLFERPHRRVAV